MTTNLLSSSQSAQPALAPRSRPFTAPLILSGLWLVIFFASLFAPPLLDDADATHANAARHIALSGDWTTLYVNGVRYLEKAPLPYWLVAISFRIFGFNTFAAHLPQAIAVLLLALLGFHWARQAFDDRTALYTGVAVLTSAGVFLFTRIFIPEILLSLLLCTALYAFLQALEPHSATTNIDSPTEPGNPSFAASSQRVGYRAERDRTLLPPNESVILTEGAPLRRSEETPAFRFSPTTYAYLLWTTLALAVLTKGLIALVFFFGTAIVYLSLTGQWRSIGKLKPITGTLLFLAIAAPWHILAGLRNTDGTLLGQRHGFFWFYFINEHFLRFLGKRFPMDYNKLPTYLFWSLHLVWLFPWALFAPLPIIALYRWWRRNRASLAERLRAKNYPQRTTLLLTLFSTLVLLFFSISTNQEYYTFPAYLPLLILIAAALTRAESSYAQDKSSRRWITVAHTTLTVIGLAVAITLFLGLWSSRHLPYVPDIGDLLAHRGVGDYTLSMSHLFDLTGPSFAALRLPATLAALAFAFGPAIAWFLRTKRRHLAATMAIALTSTTFLIAAHIALIRFGPMLSSQTLAAKIQQLEVTGAIPSNTPILLYGDQSYGSSIPFYLGRQVSLVNGRSSSMLFGSTFPDAPPIFLTDADLLTIWGTGPRIILFVPLERRDIVDHLLGDHKILITETSGKALFTDRPLTP